MRKWIISIVVLLLLIIGFLLFFIPSPIVIFRSFRVGANQNVVYRSLTNDRLIDKWWQKKENGNPSTPAGKPTIIRDKYTYTFKPGVINVVEVQIEGEGKRYGSFISILPVQQDSSQLVWKAELESNNNLLGKIEHYLEARSIKKDIATISDALQEFLQNSDNIYGLHIERERVRDTLLVTTKIITDTIPSAAAYYNLIQSLREHISREGATETNYPMLNIAEFSNKYETMVAIPVNKEVPVSGGIKFKRMVKGNILSAEIKGGVHTINEGLTQMENFIFENGMTSPAVPYQLLVTDRLNEKDTAKWITKLYYPVF